MYFKHKVQAKESCRPVKGIKLTTQHGNVAC